MSDLIKCLKCGHVLIAGAGQCIMFFGSGTSLECLKCVALNVIGSLKDW